MTYEEHRTPDLKDLIALLRRRWKLIATFAMTGAILALVIGTSIPPSYTSKAQLLVARSDAGPADVLDEAVVDTHIELIVSPRHLLEVQDSLATDPPPRRSAEATHSPFLNTVIMTAWAKLQGALATILPHASVEASPMQTAEDSDGEAIADELQIIDFAELQEGISVYKEQRSRVIAVTFTANDPDLAAFIANRIVENYVKRGREGQLAQRRKLERELAERIPSAKVALERAEAAVRDHRIASGLLDEKSIEALDRQIAELRRQLAIDLAKAGMGNTSLSPLRDHHEIAPGVAELNGVQLSSEPPIRAADGPSQSSRDALEERLRRTAQRLRSLEQSRESLREAETRLKELEREASAAAQLYESLLRKQTELSVQGPIQQDVHIVSAAMPPEQPSSPSPVLFVLPAFVAFAITGGLLVIVKEQFDRRVRSERDVEEFVGVPCIGLLPKRRRFRLHRARHNLIDKPFNIYGEAIRSVVTTALSRRRIPSRQRQFRNCAVFAVTSSEPGEGKTTLAVSFAVSVGMLGQRVLLIDLDFRSKPVAAALGKIGKDAADKSEGADSARVVVRNIAKLGIDCLPLADRREDALSFLMADQLSSILNDLRGQYDCIIIDSPPLLGATEARTIAAIADNVILAFKWGSTEIETASRALRQLQHSGIKDIQRRVFGVITQVNPRKHRFS